MQKTWTVCSGEGRRHFCYNRCPVSHISGGGQSRDTSGCHLALPKGISLTSVFHHLSFFQRKKIIKIFLEGMCTSEGGTHTEVLTESSPVPSSEHTQEHTPSPPLTSKRKSICLQSVFQDAHIKTLFFDSLCLLLRMPLGDYNSRILGKERTMESKHLHCGPEAIESLRSSEPAISESHFSVDGLIF